LRDQIAALSHDIWNCPAAFHPARVGDDAKSAVLVASLHDADERADRPMAVAPQDMLANGCLAAGLFVYVDDLGTLACENLVDVIRCAMKLLCADNEVNVGKAIDQFLTAALRHAAHEAEDDIRPCPAQLARERLHFAESFLL